MPFGFIASAIGAIGALKAGSDQKKALKQQGQIAIADAMHRKEVSAYNAGILKDQAERLRNEQVKRLQEVYGINTGRLTDDMEINIGRIQEAFDTNAVRLVEGAGRAVSRLKEDSLIQSARIQEVADTQVRRLEKQASETILEGGDQENNVRRIAAETISATRAFYGARNVIIDSGTPAALQLDTARMGEVDALRIRRNYRLQAEAILDRANDIKSEALFKIGEINRVTAHQIGDIRREGDTTYFDMTRDMGYQLSDINRITGQQLDDLSRIHGYDLSDVEFEALKLDQQAALTLMEGDAQLTAGYNRASALNQAGRNAMTQSILGAAGSVISAVDPKWLTPKSAAATAATPVTVSQPAWVRS